MLLFFILKSWVIHDFGKINWDYIESIYPSKNLLLKEALDEANAYSKRGNKSVLKGALKWFWDDDWNTIKYDNSKYSLLGVTKLDSQELLNNTWHEFLIDNYWSYCILNSLGIFLFIVNTIMKDTIVKVVTWVGFKTQSELNKFWIIAIFASRFINTAIVLLVRKASISGYSFPYFGAFFYSIYYNFDLDWYREIGSSIVIASMFGIISPIIDLLIDFSKRSISLANDKREFTWDKYTTRWKTVQKYVNTYGGSEYKIYNKYSYIISLSWITFMLGSGLPILYPIFWASLLVLWIVDRLWLAYRTR